MARSTLLTLSIHQASYLFLVVFLEVLCIFCCLGLENLSQVLKVLLKDLVLDSFVVR